MSIQYSLLGPLATAIIVPIVIAKLLKTAKSEAIPRAGKLWVEYDRVFKVVAVFFALFAIALLVAWFFVGPLDKRPVALSVTLFAVLAGYLIVEFFGVKIGFDEKQIYSFSGWRKRRVVLWSDVISVTYSVSAKWWVLQTRDSGKIRIHEFLSGRSSFFLALHRITGINPD